jgi:NAD-dependent SIR2 family protein deacetylase
MSNRGKSSAAHPTDCACAFCRNDKDFVAPDHLVEKIAAGEVVIFAGAGISTENKTYCTTTFYEDIKSDLNVSDDPTFPDLMTRFCEQPDGRIKLLEKIKHRFGYFRSFEDFYDRMSRFHRALAPLYMITDVVTTNWDDFFERECEFDPFVYDSDMAFWDAAKRRVMKIHGSITNFGSIVATAEDYHQSSKRLNDGPLGAQLKSLIARRTVVYAGYSLSDDNYLRLIRNIAKMMAGNIRQSYFISPSIERDKIQSAPIPLTPIETDGAYFFEKIRGLISERCKITRDAAFVRCAILLDRLAQHHDKTANKFIKTQHPLLIFALSYQDGLSHALRRILRQRKTGEYHSLDHVHSLVHAYMDRFNEFTKRKDYWNAAYAEGYKNGLMFLMLASTDDGAVEPLTFELPFPTDVRSITAAVKRDRTAMPRAVRIHAQRILTELPKSAQLVPDHTPYL